MQTYLDCLRKNGNNSTPCRHLNKDYLECRMNRCVLLPRICALKFANASRQWSYGA